MFLWLTGFMSIVPLWMLITGSGLLQYALLEARLLAIQHAPRR
jgi:hypothetical protein